MSSMADVTGAAFQDEGAQLSPQQERLASLVLPPGEHVTVHMVHLNHLDLSWYWQLPDTVQMCLETIRWHTELLEAHPDARYSHTQCFILRVVERLDSALFARFAELVRQGRVELDSGQVVEPDSNLSSGESLARQFLYGQRYLQAHFGRRATVLVNSDSFGHPRSLPQLMRQAGIEGFIFKRPRQRYVDLPESPFHWIGIDGEPILAVRFINKGAGLPSLSQYYELPVGRSDLQEKVDRNLAAGVHHIFASHCNSDAGGVTPYLAPFGGPGYAVRYSTPSQFITAIAAESAGLPAFSGTLGPIFQGCYTTHIEEKEHCRRAERELRAIELLWSLVALEGGGYPRAALVEAWWRLNFLQFHDIVTGTGTPESHRDATSLYHELSLKTLALRRRAQHWLDHHAPCDTPRTFLVANPRPSPDSGITQVDVEIPLQRGGVGSSELPPMGWLRDPAGQLVPYQMIDRRRFQRYMRGAMLFPCADLPPLGLAAYRLAEPSTVEVGRSGLAVAEDGRTIENEHLRVELGGAGIVRALVSKADGRSWLAPGGEGVRLELWPETDYLGDYGSPMKAWFLGVTDHREALEIVGEPAVIERGPVRATVCSEQRWGSSRFAVDVSLYAGQPWVELRFDMDWQEQEVLARLCVEPGPLGNPVRRLYGIPFGYEAATGDEQEVAASAWAALVGSDGGLAILNRDRPGHCFREGALRVSLVRCATGDWDPRTDQGQVRATLRLMPFKPTDLAAVIAAADQFNHPPVAWQADAVTGEPAPAPGIPLWMEGAGIQTACFKAAEDGLGLVLRLVEATGVPQAATLHLGHPLAGWSVWRANLIEDPVQALPVSRFAVTLEFEPFEIKTLVLRGPGMIPDLSGVSDVAIFG